MTDFAQFNATILDRIDVRATAASWGVRFTNREPTSDGWLACHAIDPNREDRNPSAAVNVRTGRYRDLGSGDDQSCSLFDLGAKLNISDDWRAVRTMLANQVGVSMTDSHSNGQFVGSNQNCRTVEQHETPSGPAVEQLRWSDEPLTESNVAGLIANKAPVSVEAIEDAGGRLATWYGFDVVVLPAVDSVGEPTGYLLVRTDGEAFPQSGGVAKRKAHTLRGSRDGWIAPAGIELAKHAKTIVRVEGWGDALAAYPHLPDETIVVSNTHGCGSTRADFQIFAGREVVAIGDADRAGQDGLAKFVDKVKPIARSVRVARLPYELTEKHGKDVRDFLNEGGDMREMIESAEPVDDEGDSRQRQRLSWQRFPTQALPSECAALVKASAAKADVDECMVALPVLTALSGAVGLTRMIRDRNGHSEFGIIWTVVVADAGSRKSSSRREALAAIENINRELRRQNATNEATFRADDKIFRARLKEWNKKQDGDPPEPPSAPPRLRLIIQDQTIETVQILLGDNHRGLIATPDELNALMSSFGRYAAKGDGGPDQAFWCAAYEGDSYHVDRVAREVFIPRCGVAVCGGIQPGIAQEVFQGSNAHSGFSARFVMSMPRDRRHKADTPPVPDEVQANYDDLITALYRCCEFIADEDGERTIIRGMTPEATRLSREYHDECQDLRVELNGHPKAVASKSVGMLMRVALLLHECEVVRDRERVKTHVSGEVMRRAVTLTRWARDESLRVWEHFRETADERAQRLVCETLEDQPKGMTVRNIQRKLKTYKSDELQEVLAGLREAGAVTVQPSGKSEVWKLVSGGVP